MMQVSTLSVDFAKCWLRIPESDKKELLQRLAAYEQQKIPSKRIPSSRFQALYELTFKEGAHKTNVQVGAGPYKTSRYFLEIQLCPREFTRKITAQFINWLCWVCGSGAAASAYKTARIRELVVTLSLPGVNSEDIFLRIGNDSWYPKGGVFKSIQRDERSVKIGIRVRNPCNEAARRLGNEACPPDFTTLQLKIKSKGLLKDLPRLMEVLRHLPFFQVRNFRERVSDDFARDCAEHGVNEAMARVSDELKRASYAAMIRLAESEPAFDRGHWESAMEPLLQLKQLKRCQK